MVDLSVAAVALLVLAVVVIAMARGSRRIPIGAGLAVIVLAVCARTAGQVVAIRIPAFPGERPLPVKIVVETTVVS